MPADTNNLTHGVYLDWEATAPLGAAAREAMMAYLAEGNIECGNANANALYGPGRKAFAQLEAYRKQVAQLLDARPDEIIFTSGSTESCNAAIIGMALAYRKAHAKDFAPGGKGALVAVSAIEHAAVLRPCMALKDQGFRVAVVNPDKQGIVQPEALERVFERYADVPRFLVAVQWQNNVVGTIQPIEQLAECAHRQGALFYCDATQAIGKMPVRLAHSGVDASCLSAHKIEGPKGIGVLFLKAHMPFASQQLGGHQEFDRRSGTQNVCGVAGLTAALQYAIDHLDEEARRLTELRQYTARELAKIPGVTLTLPYETDAPWLTPNLVHFRVRGFESETLILQLDARDVWVSGGSACSSNSLDPSPVLTAMGVPKDDAFTAIRISFGQTTSQDDIDRFIQALKEVVQHG